VLVRCSRKREREVNSPDNALVYQEASIEIAASPEAVYDAVSDLSRMGEWSPEATGGSWKDGGTGKVGDWFAGTNNAGARQVDALANHGQEWTRDCEVVVADRGSDFTFVVGGIDANRTWWSYEMASSAAGTTLTEKWWIVNKPPVWLERTEEAFQQRVALTLDSIKQTIAGVKVAVEAG
jgi:hypothetical protein